MAETIEHPAAAQAPAPEQQEAPAAPATTPAASPLDLPAEQFRAGLDRRQENRQALISWIWQALEAWVDYGWVWSKKRREWSKPFLQKPGAEKICGMLGVTVHYPNLPDYEQAALNGVALEHIILRAEIRDGSGNVVANGVGARSLKQDYGDLNKALKMAEKSAHIDATLRLAGISEIFTQDLEDMAGLGDGGQGGGASGGEQGGESQPQPITEAQHKRLEARISELGLDREKVKAYAADKYGVEHLNQLGQQHFEHLDAQLDRWEEQIRARDTAGEGQQ
jgi:hypothetical protein